MIRTFILVYHQRVGKSLDQGRAGSPKTLDAVLIHSSVNLAAVGGAGAVAAQGDEDARLPKCGRRPHADSVGFKRHCVNPRAHGPRLSKARLGSAGEVGCGNAEAAERHRGHVMTLTVDTESRATANPWGSTRSVCDRTIRAPRPQPDRSTSVCSGERDLTIASDAGSRTTVNGAGNGIRLHIRRRLLEAVAWFTTPLLPDDYSWSCSIRCGPVTRCRVASRTCSLRPRTPLRS